MDTMQTKAHSMFMSRIHDGTAYLSTLSGSYKREVSANIEAKGNIKWHMSVSIVLSVHLLRYYKDSAHTGLTWRPSTPLNLTSIIWQVS